MIDSTSYPARKPDSYFGKLIRTDKNGTKYLTCRCSRCNGSGYYPIQHYWGIEWGVCYRCEGSAIDPTPEKIYTPEHEAKLEKDRTKREAKRMAEHKARQEAWEQELAEGKTERAKKVLAARERERQYLAKKAQWEAERKVGEWIGEVGKKITFTAKLVAVKEFERTFNYQTVATVMLLFKTDGNTVIWFTNKFGVSTEKLKDEDNEFLKDQEFTITATVKEHSEKDGKATIITRAKIV